MEGREIHVRPQGSGSDSGTRRFELSDMDHTMPKIYVQIAEIFELPLEADRDAIMQNLTRGLEFALGQYPVMAGVLRMDDSNGRMWVTTNGDSTVGFFVKDASDLPSFEYLEANNFPVQLIDGHKVLPKKVTEKQLFSPLGDNADDATIISTFQVTFIEGGLILGAAIHHNCSDGPGCNGFLTTWAEASAAAARGAPFQPIDPVNNCRAQLSAPKPSAERWDELDGQFPVLRDLGAPPPSPPTDFVMPKLKVRMWHVPRSRAAALKAACVQPGADAWVSTYDCIMALFWKTITRAKRPLLAPAPNKPVVLVHAVNTRHLLAPPLPDRFLGNAVALPRVGAVSIEELLSEGRGEDSNSNLPALAAAVRASIRAITPQYVAELPAWVAGLADRRYIAIAMDAFLALDLAGTSWQAMTPYEQHDFGFGLPRAMRWPHPQFEGYVFVLPSRAAVKKGDDDGDEGLEMVVCLEESCHNRLMEDPELLRFAQPRGHDA